jgi:hypothetical protein
MSVATLPPGRAIDLFGAMAGPAKLVPSLLTQLPSRPEQRSEVLNVVEPATSPSAAFALSRFEFEAGKGNEGTKILMVEWDTSASPTRAAAAVDKGKSRPDTRTATTHTHRTALGDWEVSWEGTTTVFPQLDMEAESATESGTSRRVYFLLPPGASIPPLVTITQRRQGGIVLRTKPMPAIFAQPGDGNDDDDDNNNDDDDDDNNDDTTNKNNNKRARGTSMSALQGRQGVLHTMWAKSRLRALTEEVEAEMKSNGESVGLEMALQERSWIMDHFALRPDGSVAEERIHDASQEPRGDLHVPMTPRSPTQPRGRLGEKLRGLKLATSPMELAAASQGVWSSRPFPLSPVPRRTVFRIC